MNAGSLFGAGKPPDDFLRILNSILEQGVENGAKISTLLKNIVFLESALDGLLDGKQIERAAGDGSDNDIRSFFSELIPVLDNLERLKQAVMQTGSEDWRSGITLLFERMMELLNSYDFQLSAVSGMAFDPERHEAVSTEYNSHLPPGSVSEVIESGWLYQDTVLRYAKVTVTKDRE
jgi:molecular chaperone GrpE